MVIYRGEREKRMEKNTAFPNIDREEGKTALFGALRAIEALRPITDEELNRAAEAVIAADLDYMTKAGVDRGEVYDEDAAFLAIKRALAAALPKRRGDWDELADFAMEAWEIYLDAAGVIEWD